MATPYVSINPYAQTSAPTGLFNKTSTGLVQGDTFPDPAARYKLTTGVIASDETAPMWGGIGINAKIPSLTSPSFTPTTISRSDALTNLMGFTTFTQSVNGITSPASPVPQFGSGTTLNYYRINSGARIILAIDPTFAATLDDGTIAPACSWDFTRNMIVPYAPAYADNTITGATWASTSGGRTTFTVSTDPSSTLTAGDIINVEGVVATGGTGVGFNGAFVVVSTTSSTIVVTQAADSSPGTYSSGGTVIGGGGQFPGRILQVATEGCKTVEYDDTNNLVTWATSGNACAVVELIS